MLEMCVGLALRHVAPAALSKQALHEGVDVGATELGGDRADLVEALVVMGLDRLGPTLEILEGMAVGGQGELHVADLADAIERVEERLQRIRQIRDTSDMRRDRGQHVVAREKRAGVGIVETDMIRRMARRVLHEPLAAGELQHVAMLDVVRDLRKETTPPDRREGEPAQPLANRGAIAGALPRGGCRDPLDRAQDVAHRILGPAPVALEQLHVDREVVDRGFAVVIVAAMHVGMRRSVGAGVPLLRRRPAEMEGPMGDDLGAGLLRDLHGAPEMIGMRMRDEDRVDMTRLEIRLLQAVLDRVPRARAREPRVDHGNAIAIDEGVHVDVSQARDPDRKLHAKDVLRDLADLFLGVFLLLSFRLAHRAGE